MDTKLIRIGVCLFIIIGALFPEVKFTAYTVAIIYTLWELIDVIKEQKDGK